MIRLHAVVKTLICVRLNISGATGTIYAEFIFKKKEATRFVAIQIVDILKKKKTIKNVGTNVGENNRMRAVMVSVTKEYYKPHSME